MAERWGEKERLSHLLLLLLLLLRVQKGFHGALDRLMAAAPR